MLTGRRLVGYGPLGLWGLRFKQGTTAQLPRPLGRHHAWPEVAPVVRTEELIS